MNIAVITGASSGLGIEYVRAAAEQYPDLDEIWVIARRLDRLQALADRFSHPLIRPVALDLLLDDSFQAYADLLKAENPQVRLLINNAGFGKLDDFADIPAAVQGDMVTLNDKAPVMMTAITLPYMTKGAVILMTCSIASFVPTPRMTVYCSTKAFILSLCKSLREELKPRGIRVHAACPGPMDTEFLAIADIPQGRSHTFDTLPRVSAARMADRSLCAARKGRATYTDRWFYKFYRVLGKLLPHNWLMKRMTTC